MGAVLVPLVLIAAVLVIGLVAVQAMTRRHEKRDDQLAKTDVETVTWNVPEGQDPVPVVTSLRAEGYQTSTDAGRIVVGHPDGVDREQVRALIAHADLNLEGDPARRTVRFTDEA